jgi:hypothetical protein
MASKIINESKIKPAGVHGLSKLLLLEQSLVHAGDEK